MADMLQFRAETFDVSELFDGVLCLVKSWHAMGQSMGQHPFLHVPLLGQIKSLEPRMCISCHGNLPASRSQQVWKSTTPGGVVCHPTTMATPCPTQQPPKREDICSSEWPAGCGFNVWRHYTIIAHVSPELSLLLSVFNR